MLPVNDHHCHQAHGHFTHGHFRYALAENVYYCPEGKPLRYRGQRRSSRQYVYCATAAHCQGCPQRGVVRPAPYRSLSVRWHESAWQTVRALAATPAYQRWRRSLRAESETEVKMLRAITSRSILANQISTWLSQDE